MFNSKDTLFGKRDETAPAKPLATPQRAGSGTGRSDTATPAPTTPTPVPVAADTSSNPATAQSGSKLTVGPDIKLKGVEITDCDTLVVEGRVEASMDSRVMQIAQHGVYSGTVGVDVAEIRGRFEGDLTARKQLVIYATGYVSGTIRYGKLTIEEGGELSGTVSALSAAAPVAAGQAANNTGVDIMTPYDPFAHAAKPGAKGAGAAH